MPEVIKVWCQRREKKKCVIFDTFDFEDFVAKVKSKFSAQDHVRLVLEEDGTDIDDSDSLEAFKDKVFMLLEGNVAWTPIESLTSPSPPLTPTSNDNPTSSATPTSTQLQTPATPRTPLRPFNQVPNRKRKVWLSNFVVPWSKIKTNILKKLERSVGCEQDPEKKLTNTEYNDIIKVVVPEIREFDKHPGRDAIRTVAVDMTGKFKVLADLDEDGKVIGSGLGTLCAKLELHNSYLNRPSNDSSLINLVTSPVGPDGRRKRRAEKKTAQSGTKEWQPEYPDDECKQSQSEKQKWLISESRKSEKDRDTDKINNFMHITYPSQRLLLNSSNTSVAEVKNAWPFLLEQKFLAKHCERLVENFESNVDFWQENKLKKIIAFMEERVTVEKAKAILEKNEETRKGKMALADEGLTLINNAKKSPVVGSLHLVMHKFSERKRGSKLLFVHKEEGATRDEIIAAPFSASPCIVTVGRNMFEGSNHYVVTEGTIISAHANVSQALTVVYCLYYLFNMRYPDQLGHTWEFLQRFIFKNNPNDGSKNPKKKCSENIASPVNSFMRDLLRFSVHESEDVNDEDMSNEN